jgi:glycosyltransferase involved in cell wall biosynthesis
MKKVLIVTYYWPPAGGPGVQRWLKFVTYLPQFGISPVLYIPENPHYPLTDESLLAEIPSGIKIYKNRISEPYRFAKFLFGNKTNRISAGIIRKKNSSLVEKFLLFIRGNLFIPDARVNWVKPSVKQIAHILQKEKIETIITTGPPHSMHLIGCQLRERGGIRWIADFRDPWTSIGYHKELRLGKWAQRTHKRLEKRVLTSADTIIVTSHTTKKEFQELTKKPIIVITNGYDDDYTGDAALDSSFTMSHIGSLLSERNPKVLWEVLAELIKEQPAFKEHFKLQLIGVVSQEIITSLQEHGLTDYVTLYGYLTHAEAVQYQRRSQVLVLLEIDSHETKGIIPGKLFEYMAARRPIIGIGPENWEVSDIVRKTKSGVVFNYDDHSKLKSTLLRIFMEYSAGNIPLKTADITEFSRKELTRKLATHL